MPTSENLITKSPKVWSLLVGGMLAASAVALPANGEPLTIVAASSSGAVPFQQEAIDALYSLPAAPVTTTTAPPPTTTTHTHAPRRPRPAAAQPGECGGWRDLIAAHFPGEVERACRVMMCESKGNPQAQNSRSSASGLWQFLSRTWESVTGTPAPASQYSAETQTAAAARLRNSSGWGQWSCR